MTITKKHYIFSFIILAVVSTAVGLFVSPFTADNQNTVQVGGPFQLTHHSGKLVSNEDYLGEYLLIYFGFTNCPAICPTTLMDMTRALNQLEKLSPEAVEEITPIFISVDPKRDTPEALKLYISHFHKDFEGLTGTTEELINLTNAYGSYFSYSPSDSDGFYNVNHSSYIYLMGKKGEYLTHYSPEQSVEEIIDSMKNHILLN